jgi:hypothetical protein
MQENNNLRLPQRSIFVALQIVQHLSIVYNYEHQMSDITTTVYIFPNVQIRFSVLDCPIYVTVSLWLMQIEQKTI